jgi:hypothetical protein
MHPRKSLIPAILQEHGIELSELLRRFMALNDQVRLTNGRLEGLTAMEVPSNFE